MFRAAGLLISVLLLSQCCSLGVHSCSGHPWGTDKEVVSESPQRVLENMKSRQRFTLRLVCNLVNICRVLYKRLLTTLSACNLDSQGSWRHFEEQHLQYDIEQCQAFWSQMAMIRAMAVVAWILTPDFANPSVTRELRYAVWTLPWSTVCRQALNPGARTGRETLRVSPGVLKAPGLALEAAEHSTLQSIKCNLSGCYLKCLPCFCVLNRLTFQSLCVKIR